MSSAVEMPLVEAAAADKPKSGPAATSSGAVAPTMTGGAAPQPCAAAFCGRPTSTLARWEAWLGFASLLMGSLDHMWLIWAPEATPALGWLFPIDEALWEHLKLAFPPVIVGILVQLRYMRPLPKHTNAWLSGKLFALLLVGMWGQLLLFWFYTAFLASGHGSLIVDILISMLLWTLTHVLAVYANIFAERHLAHDGEPRTRSARFAAFLDSRLGVEVAVMLMWTQYLLLVVWTYTPRPAMTYDCDTQPWPLPLFFNRQDCEEHEHS